MIMASRSPGGQAAAKRKGLKLSFDLSPQSPEPEEDPFHRPTSTSPYPPHLWGQRSSPPTPSQRGGVQDVKRNMDRNSLERIRSESLDKSGKLKITPDKIYDFTADDLLDLGEIGRGAFGSVNKMCHEQSQTTMAVKRIRSTVDEREQKQLLMDLDVVMRSNDCTYIVQFFGALFKEGDCWICMELMDTSFDKFYKYIYSLNRYMPEDILGMVTVATVKALNYLKTRLNIIHRDVKPSNILLDRKGNIKMCDFGISGQLVDSIAKTRDAGCRPYMAPERIDPMSSRQGYDIRSDVWSLGITLMELATGKFPYPKWNSVFDQLSQVVKGDPPQLNPKEHNFSPDFINFVNICLTKDASQRPKYKELLKHMFIQRYETQDVDVASFVLEHLDQMPPHLPTDLSSY
ncbi:dual specificity mitogen-activated protein kinase kinase 4-like isoform X2 [Branchiostoma floridae]|uniref:mitogen-activated protein kinase kinase n=1 Tax=Branchiostoma floridae TaxID=7739 RepID=A0A9J7NB50_BRAFL|nr:dual specificity mitogen-activated protein kinase kinase 4-like isoform X2 [Branchiostoma floridae]